jgi:hypothetical protein
MLNTRACANVGATRRSAAIAALRSSTPRAIDTRALDQFALPTPHTERV